VNDSTAERQIRELWNEVVTLREERDALRADRDAADEASATNAEERVRLAVKHDALAAHIRYAGQVLDKITAECASLANVEKPAEVAYGICYIRALAHNASLDLGLAVGSQGEPILRPSVSSSPGEGRS